MSRYLIIVLCFSFLFSCQKEEVGNPVIMPLELMEIPAHFPEMDIPEDNRFTQSRWDLGKRLFYDPILSLDSTIS